MRSSQAGSWAELKQSMLPLQEGVEETGILAYDNRYSESQGLASISEITAMDFSLN